MRLRRYVGASISLGALVAVIVGLAGANAGAPAKSPQAPSPRIQAAANTATPLPPGFADVTNSPTGLDVPLREIVIKALDARQKWGLIPGSQRGRAPSSQGLDSQAAIDQVGINTLFGPGQAGKERAALNRSIAMQKTGVFHLVGGGVANARDFKVALSGSAGIVDVTVDTWSRFEQKDPQGSWVVAEPHNTIIFHLNLAKTDGIHWTVASCGWDFAPGSEP